MKQIALLMFITLGFGSVFGATITVEGDGRTYYVALTDPDAECVLKEIGDTGAMEASCTAETYYVTATIEGGCGDSFGPTYCGTTRPGNPAPVSTELWCSDVRSYALSVGSGDAHCEEMDGVWSCQSLSGYASVACDSGCREVRGAGVCCVVATEDCPPGIAGDKAE